jgi:hypothetical protein
MRKMFTSFKLTNNGKAMHIKSVFGDSIKFTKVAFGSGAKPDDFAQMNELNNVVVSVPFVSYDDTTNQNILNLKWELDTSEISNSFTWSEYGLYAEDKDGNEFLYAYAYDDTPITIDKIEQGVVSLYVGYVTVSITDTDNITVELGEYDTVTVNQFKAHTENANNPHNVTAEQVGLGKVENVSSSDAVPKFTEANRFENISSGDKTSTLWGKVKKAISTLSNHLLDKNNPHNVIWRQIFSSSNEALPVEYGGTGGNTGIIKSDVNYDYTIAQYQSGGRISLTLEKGVWIVIGSVGPIFGTNFDGNIYLSIGSDSNENAYGEHEDYYVNSDWKGLRSIMRICNITDESKKVWLYQGYRSTISSARLRAYIKAVRII